MKPLHRIVLACSSAWASPSATSLRGHLLPGIVGGVLAAVLLYLVIGRFERADGAAAPRRERSGGLRRRSATRRVGRHRARGGAGTASAGSATRSDDSPARARS